jgi:translation elongation factor EF-4
MQYSPTGDAHRELPMAEVVMDFDKLKSVPCGYAC